MTREQRVANKISRWRGLSADKQRQLSHASVIEHVKKSMAMEGEPVSSAWLKKNAR